METNERYRGTRLYNVLFPVWMLILIPTTWLIVFPGNFIIDSAVLLIALRCLGIEEKRAFYKKHILLIFLFGMLSDFVGAGFLLLLAFVFEAGGPMGDSPIITIPAIIISSALIFVFNYFITFRKTERCARVKLSLVFAIATAPYTFLIPSSLLYGF